MKKILIITNMFPDRKNPVIGIFVKHQVDELAKRHSIKVISTYFPRKISTYNEKLKNYEVTHINFTHIKRIFLSSLLLYRIYTIPKINKIISVWQPDIIHVHDCRHIPELFVLRILLNSKKIPQFLTVHNIRTHPDSTKSKQFKWFYKFSLGTAYRNWTHVFTVNSNLKSIISNYISPEKITVVGNAINPTPDIDMSKIEYYKSLLKGESFKIISVGNLISEKGFNLLLEAIHILIQKQYDVQAVIIGSGPEEKNLLSMIKKLSLSDRVDLAGSVENDIVRNLYPLYDAFVLPSYRETFGIVYIEAMYAGLPVIGVEGQGIDGIVEHGVNGLLAKPNDVYDLVNQIEFLINNRELRESFARIGMKIIKDDYQLTNLINRICSIYEQ